VDPNTGKALYVTSKPLTIDGELSIQSFLETHSSPSFHTSPTNGEDIEENKNLTVSIWLLGPMKECHYVSKSMP